MKDISKSEIRREPGSARCTFEVSVKFLQNATWQGHIHWVEKDSKQNFRSVLEMLKLMDEALADGVEEEPVVTWNDSN